MIMFFFSSRRRHTRLQGDWSSDVCSSDLNVATVLSETAIPHIVVEEDPDRVREARSRGLRVLLSDATVPHTLERSEERRVGKECRSRGPEWHQTSKREHARYGRYTR